MMAQTSHYLAEGKITPLLLIYLHPDVLQRLAGMEREGQLATANGVAVMQQGRLRRGDRLVIDISTIGAAQILNNPVALFA